MLGTRVYGFVHNVQVPWFFKNCLQQVKLPAGVWICVLVQKLRCRSIRGWRNYPPWGFCVIKIKCHKEVTKYCTKNPGFSHYFCLIMERYGSGSEPWLTNPEPGGQKTYRSGSGTLFPGSVVDTWHFGSDPRIRTNELRIRIRSVAFKMSKKSFLFYFVKVHWHQFSKIKSNKEVTKQ
jgi:hypothetical protein